MKPADIHMTVCSEGSCGTFFFLCLIIICDLDRDAKSYWKTVTIQLE